MLVVSVISSAARRRRRRAYEEDIARQEQAQRQGGGDADPFGGASPFEMLPFGGLLESLMTGMGARSFAWDEATGQWVEVSDEVPEVEPAAERAPAANGDAPRRRR